MAHRLLPGGFSPGLLMSTPSHFVAKTTLGGWIHSVLARAKDTVNEVLSFHSTHSERRVLRKCRREKQALKRRVLKGGAWKEQTQEDGRSNSLGSQWRAVEARELRLTEALASSVAAWAKRRAFRALGTRASARAAKKAIATGAESEGS